MSVKFKIEYSGLARNQIKKLPENVSKMIREHIESLADNPTPMHSEKMKGMERTWRLKLPPYRVIYEIHRGQVLVYVIEVALRKNVYR